MSFFVQLHAGRFCSCWNDVRGCWCCWLTEPWVLAVTHGHSHSSCAAFIRAGIHSAAGKSRANKKLHLDSTAHCFYWRGGRKTSPGSVDFCSSTALAEPQDSWVFVFTALGTLEIDLCQSFWSLGFVWLHLWGEGNKWRINGQCFGNSRAGIAGGAAPHPGQRVWSSAGNFCAIPNSQLRRGMNSQD